MNKNGVIIAIFIVFLLALLGSCSDSSESSSYSKYSNTYKNNAEYREDVGEIADAFGVTEEEVDRKINAITGGK